MSIFDRRVEGLLAVDVPSYNML